MTAGFRYESEPPGMMERHANTELPNGLGMFLFKDLGKTVQFGKEDTVICGEFNT